MEKVIKGSRLQIAVKEESSEELEIVWNQKIKTILYANETIRLWKNYIYKDALWFADLDKSGTAQEAEIKELIGISADMLANAKNQDAIEQLSNTLRIGLLSYSRFFTSYLSRDFISELIDRFSQDKFWKVWIAIFEMATQSNDPFNLALRKDFFDFYKRITLSRSWQLVIKELYKPNNGYLLQLFKQYSDELTLPLFEDHQ